LLVVGVGTQITITSASSLKILFSGGTLKLKARGILYVSTMISLVVIWQFFESYRGYLLKQGLELEFSSLFFAWVLPSFFSLATIVSLPLLFFDEDVHFFGEKARQGVTAVSSSPFAPLVVYLLIVVSVWSSYDLVPTDGGVAKFIQVIACMLCYYFWIFIHRDTDE